MHSLWHVQGHTSRQAAGSVLRWCKVPQAAPVIGVDALAPLGALFLAGQSEGARVDPLCRAPLLALPHRDRPDCGYATCVTRKSTTDLEGHIVEKCM